MTKAKKINFELDERLVAQAQAFALQRGVSLTKLVAAFFASLGEGRQPGASPGAVQKILAEVSIGKRSLVDAASELGLQDAGFLLQLMREDGLPLPSLPEELARAQADSGLSALQACLRPRRKTKRQAGEKQAVSV